MATTTPNYNYSLPTVGGDADLWGGFLNANWTQIDTDLQAVKDGAAQLAGTNVFTNLNTFNRTGSGDTAWLGSLNGDTKARVTVGTDFTAIIGTTDAFADVPNQALAWHHTEERWTLGTAYTLGAEIAKKDYVDTALADYVPKTGGEFTGAVTGTTFSASGAMIVTNSTNPSVFLQPASGAYNYSSMQYVVTSNLRREIVNNAAGGSPKTFEFNNAGQSLTTDSVLTKSELDALYLTLTAVTTLNTVGSGAMLIQKVATNTGGNFGAGEAVNGNDYEYFGGYTASSPQGATMQSTGRTGNGPSGTWLSLSRSAHSSSTVFKFGQFVRTI
jgi:hypothetical protein